MRVSIYDPITLKQGTIYTPSNCNDLLTKSLYDEDLQISPSAFVCLNLPNWSAKDWPNGQAFYVPSLWFGDETMTDVNVLVPALLQNNWDNCSLYATEKILEEDVIFTESAFWKMLQTTNTFKPHFANGVYTQAPEWNEFVTYIGKPIDLGLQKLNGQVYSEMFMFIPRNAKRVHAQWNARTYKGLQDVAYVPETYSENAVGLNEGDTQLIKAIYDMNVSNSIATQLDRYDMSKGSDHLILDLENYTTSNDDIEFNVILIYADAWLKSNPTYKSKFLHSVYFTSIFKDTGVSGYWNMPTFVKTAETVDGSSNALAFRLCTRMTGCNTTYVPIEVSSVDGISLDMYMQSIQQLSDQSNRIEQISRELKTVQKQYDDLVIGLGVNENALTVVNELKQQLLEQNIYIANDQLLDLFIQISNAMKSSDKQVIVNINVQQ